jgi:membrane associated rhomboid family serine protease
VSASLLHVDFRHLMVNLVLTLTFGHTLTVMTGASWSWSIFFVSAWIGSIIATLSHSGWFIGASAGVFGLLGAIALSLGRAKKPGALGQGLLITGLSIFLGTVGIGNSTAHLGGFAAGVGLVMVPRRFHMSIQRLTWLSILIGLILMVVSRVG